MSTTLPGTGKVIASDPLNATTGLNGGAPATGEEVQRAKVTFGSAGFSRDVDSANPLPVIDPDAATSATITAIDAVVAAPAGAGQMVTGASTAGSLVALACPGGDSAWIITITGGTFTTTLYFEESIDATSATTGNWTNVNGRQTGIVNTVLGGSTSANNTFWRGNTAGAAWIRVRAVGGAITTAPVITIKVSAGTGATFLNASWPSGSNIGGRVGIDQTTPGTTNAVQVTNMIAAVETGLAKDGTDGTTPPAVLGSGTGIRGWLRSIYEKLTTSLVVTSATAANLQATVTNLALTKGTQGATGMTVQALKDAGRARVSIVFQAVAPAVADTLLTLVKVTSGVAAAGAVSIGVAAGKTLHITSVTFSLKSNAAAAAFGTMTMRQNPAGATAIGSQSEFRIDVGNTAAVAGASDKVEAVFPDGMQFSGTQTLGVSLAAQAITNIVSIAINGFEY